MLSHSSLTSSTLCFGENRTYKLSTFCNRYLDASTRDQYASGDLDARVEDVLGQIRELSIAGTV